MPMEATPISVSDAVLLAKNAAAGIGNLVVTGEVSGFRGPNARSGHCYFQVKDEQSSMSVIVWRSIYASSGIQLKDGLKLIMQGKFDVYPGSGRLSFIACKVYVSGEGLLRQQVAQLAKKLEREGLMAPERKREIPRFCTRVAVVTSLSGSVIEDVKRTLRRRNPLVAIQEVGASVQGTEAPTSMIRALKVAAAAKPDAILLVRGGGSFEDLMAFNDEALARAVAACSVPVITGIGHEPDTSICDMVADRRCSTPTAAAESVAPALDEIVQTINGRQVRLGQAFSAILKRSAQQVEDAGKIMTRSLENQIQRESVLVESLANHRCMQEPRSMIEDRKSQLAMTEQRLQDAIPRSIDTRKRNLENDSERLVSIGGRLLNPYTQLTDRLGQALTALSPLNVVKRGYAIVQDSKGHVVSQASDVSVNDQIKIRLGHGGLTAQVESVQTEENEE